MLTFTPEPVENRTAERPNWTEYGRSVIEAEIDALASLCKNLGNEFDAAIDLILSVRGRVVVSGMGKSGHIGQKIAATMASTGTPAYFVHPAEASHGDLGMLGCDDLLLAISNSGETRELSDILLFAKRRQLPIVAITGDATSTLGKFADVALELPACREACPLERAPTVSTTATLALGDALAMTLMKWRGFRDVDFVQFHPGGKLGAALLSVSDLLQMQAGRALPIVDQHAGMKDVVLSITEGMRGHAGVVNGDGRLVGVVSDGDLRRAYAMSIDGLSAADIMSKKPKVVGSDLRAHEVREMLQMHKISAVFVVDDDRRPIGLLHLQELLRL